MLVRQPFVFNTSLRENILLGAMHQTYEKPQQQLLSILDEKKRNFT